MQLTDFDYELPRQLIAQMPAKPRDHTKLLVYDRLSGQLSDDYFYNLGKYLIPKTTLVINNSRVEKSRLSFGSTEIFILETLSPKIVRALVRPGRKFGFNKPFTIGLKDKDLVVKTLAVDGSGVRELQLSLPVNDSSLDPYRQTPFPPYIKQNEALSGQYQTVYAKPPGSKAAPTAGLHFTKRLLKDLSAEHSIVKLTLHVGLGTFGSVKTAEIKNHKMHSEEFFISEHAAKTLNRASSITAVGTTCLRVLETVKKPFKPVSGETDIFIMPGYQFKAVDSLITNFHLPKSSLLILVAAFIGSVAETQRIYKHAIDQKYYFYSFGDAMLIT